MLKRVLKYGAQAILESDPDLTRWDTLCIITCVWYSQHTVDPSFRLSVMVTVERHGQAVPIVLPPNPLTAVAHITVLRAVDNG